MSNIQQDQPVAQAPKSRGCLYGCLIAFGLMAVLMIAVSVGFYMLLKGQIQKYTAEAPTEIPVVEYTPDQIAELETRMQSFSDAAEGGESDSTELVLTADDLNALIANNEDLRGRVFVKIEDGLVSGDVSVPLDELPLPGAKGRYFNGSATVDASMEGGVLIVTLTGAEVKGEPLPDQFLEAMANENLAKDVYKDPNNAKVLRRFEDIRVEGDKIYLKLKEKSEEPEPTETESTEETAEGGSAKGDENETPESAEPATENAEAVK